MAPSLQGRLGYFFKEVEPLYRDEKPISFDPVQMSFLQTLVRQDVLQANLTIAREDFFKGIVYLDYFTEVVAGRSTLLADVGVIVEELEKMHEYLDVNLKLLVRYSGLFIIKDLKGERFFRASSRKQMARRHERADRVVSWPKGNPGAGLDLFNLALGRMTREMICRDEVAAALGSFQGSGDLRAGVLADSILGVLPDDEVSPAAIEALAAGDLAAANLELLSALVTSCEDWSLRKYVDRIKSRLDS